MKLVTIHSAKGIEFPVVFIVGVTEDAFPSEGPAEEVERARRVLYTAIMRAGWRLTLSAVRGRASGLLSCIQEP
ncbi:DNA helicase II [bacterium HR32]|nr:DNA helicase II [bacterium HR32]